MLSDSAPLIAKSQGVCPSRRRRKEENPQGHSQWPADFPASPCHQLQVSFVTSLSREAGRPAGAVLLSKHAAPRSSASG